MTKEEGDKQPDAPAPDEVQTEEQARGAAPRPKRRLRRSKKSQLLDDAKKQLGKYSFLKGRSPDDPVELVVRGPKISETSGDGEALGLSMMRFARLLRAFDADSVVEDVVFGHSVTIRFKAHLEDVVRAKESEDELVELFEDLGIDPAAKDRWEQILAMGDLPDEQQKRLDSALVDSVTPLQAAAAAAADLIAAPSVDAPVASAGYGSEVAEAYKTLATAVAKSELTLLLEDPGSEETVELDSTKAGRVARELRAADEPRETTVTAFGVLSQADQEAHGFGLRLSAGQKPEQLKSKRMVRGTYEPEVGNSIRDNGLWGKEVKATILIEQDATISTSTIRPATFTLKAVEDRWKDTDSPLER